MRKKIFAILMSAMMMVTFMPSMAFAAGETATDDWGPFAGKTVATKYASEAASPAVEYARDQAVAENDAFYDEEDVEVTPHGYAGVYVKKMNTYTGESLIGVREKKATEAHNVVVKRMEVAEAEAFVADTVSNWLYDLLKYYANLDDTAKTGAKQQKYYTFANIATFLLGITDEPVTPASTSKLQEMVQKRDFTGLNNKVVASAMTEIMRIYDAYNGEKLDNLYSKNGKAEAKEVLANLFNSVKQVVKDYFDELDHQVVTYVANNTVRQKVIDGYNFCYFLVEYCEDCGANGDVTVRGIRHEMPEDLAACATSYVCKHCGKTVRFDYLNQFEEDTINIATTVAADIKALIGKNDEAIGKKSVLNQIGVLLNKLYFYDAKSGHDFKVEEESKECGTVYTLTCSKCNETFTFALPKSLNHNWAWEELTPAKCSKGTNGLKVQKCADCGAINPLSFTVVAPKHSYVEKTFEAKCTTPGYTVKVCEKCNNVIPITSKEFTLPTGHEYNIEMVEQPGCSKDGLLKIECTKCHKVDYYMGNKSALEIEAAVGMYKKNLEGTLDAATIVTIGKEYFDILNHRVKDDKNGLKAQIRDILSQLGFSEINEEALNAGTGIIKVVDTLHSTGRGQAGHDDSNEVAHYYFVGYDYELLLTGKVIELPNPNATSAHKFNTWGIVSEADCEHGTVWGPKCANCGFVLGTLKNDDGSVHKDNPTVEEDNALGHTPETVEVAATCGEPAYSYTYCTTCHMYLDANGKAMYLEDKTPAGLEDLGVKTYVKGSKPVVAKGAKCVPADEWTVLKDSTFTTVGTRVKKCQKCGAYCDSDDIAVKKLAKAYQPTLKAGKKQMTVKFKNASAAQTGFQIAYKVTGANNYKYVKTTYKQSKTIKNLKSGKKYTVKVRKYVEENGQTIYGKWCAVKYVKVK